MVQTIAARARDGAGEGGLRGTVLARRADGAEPAAPFGAHEAVF